MGSTAILIGATALGTAIICLFVGFRWGRSNVRSQIEDALDMARVSADAREFALREQLDQKMLELGELRARANEARSLQDELAQLQSSRLHNSPGVSTRDAMPEQRVQILPEQQHETEPVAAAIENPIQSFFHPKAAEPQQPNANHDAPLEKNRPPAIKFPSSFSTTFSTPRPTPETAKPQAVQTAKPQPVKPVPAVNNDDWDEFAKSLEALKNLQK